MPKTLGIWEWGCPKRCDSGIAAQNFKEEDWGDEDTIGQKISKRGAR